MGAQIVTICNVVLASFQNLGVQNLVNYNTIFVVLLVFRSVFISLLMYYVHGVV